MMGSWMVNCSEEGTGAGNPSRTTEVDRKVEPVLQVVIVPASTKADFRHNPPVRSAEEL